MEFAGVRFRNGKGKLGWVGKGLDGGWEYRKENGGRRTCGLIGWRPEGGREPGAPGEYRVKLVSMNAYGYFVLNYVLPALAGFCVLWVGNSKRWPWRKRVLVVIAVSGAAYFVAATITKAEEQTKQIAIAGIVVDEATNAGLGQALVRHTDGTETDTTEDNGNFRITLSSNVKPSDRIRIHVEKSGYRPFEESVTVPSQDLVVVLKRL